MKGTSAPHLADTTTGPQSLLGQLAWQVESDPSRVACYSVSYLNGELTAAALSVRELMHRACAVAAKLQVFGLKPGDHVLLSTSDPHFFVSCFLGLMHGGFVPIPIPPLGETRTPKVFSQRVQSISLDCSAVAAIGSISHTIPNHLFGLSIPEFTPEELLEDASTGSGNSKLRDRRSEETAFVQYSSGSTAKPRGVMVTHGNLLANCRAITTGCKFVPKDRCVTWVPLYHDMGLIGAVLTALYSQTPIYILPTNLFLTRPVSWLRAMHLFKGTITLAPNFAYELCARQIPERHLDGLDLSHWRIAFVGAEPVEAATLEVFAARFSCYGFRAQALTPVYGLAESTLAVTFPDVAAPVATDSVSRRTLREQGKAEPVDPASADAMILVSVGRAMDLHAVWIVDPVTGSPLPDRNVGEIVVRGASVTSRYVGEWGERSCLRTGDLGYMVSGELFVCGRIKEVIILGGQNYYPTDIEMVVSSVPGLRKGRIAAFEGTVHGFKRLFIAAEVRTKLSSELKAVKAAIRSTVARSHGLPVAEIFLVPCGSLPRTSSGKLQRRLCAELCGLT